MPTVEPRRTTTVDPEIAGPYDDETVAWAALTILTRQRHESTSTMLDGLERCLAHRADRIYTYTPRAGK